MAVRRKLIPKLELSVRTFNRPWMTFLHRAGLGSVVGCLCCLLTARSAGVSIYTTNYHGWPDTFVLHNAVADVMVVPSIGRIMQFRLAGETDGPFWENPAMIGKSMPQNPWETPGSFGGDKTWPAPQSAWNWPPPDVFDAAPLTAEVRDGRLILRSPVSARFGIRTVRTLSLDSDLAQLQVVTRYDKVEGDPVDVGVWVITQTKVPEAAFLPIPDSSVFASGLSDMWTVPNSQVRRHPGLIEFRRDAKESHKVGNDAASLLWVGARWTLRIDIGRIPNARYPDAGCSAELYSNPDPAGYVEMETLGPLQKMVVSQSLSATNRYRLAPRTEPDAVSEAVRALRH